MFAFFLNKCGVFQNNELRLYQNLIIICGCVTLPSMKSILLLPIQGNNTKTHKYFYQISRKESVQHRVAGIDQSLVFILKKYSTSAFQPINQNQHIITQEYLQHFFLEVEFFFMPKSFYQSRLGIYEKASSNIAVSIRHIDFAVRGMIKTINAQNYQLFGLNIQQLKNLLEKSRELRSQLKQRITQSNLFKHNTLCEDISKAMISEIEIEEIFQSDLLQFINQKRTQSDILTTFQEIQGQIQQSISKNQSQINQKIISNQIQICLCLHSVFLFLTKYDKCNFLKQLHERQTSYFACAMEMINLKEPSFQINILNKKQLKNKLLQILRDFHQHYNRKKVEWRQINSLILIQRKLDKIKHHGMELQSIIQRIRGFKKQHEIHYFQVAISRILRKDLGFINIQDPFEYKNKQFVFPFKYIELLETLLLIYKMFRMDHLDCSPILDFYKNHIRNLIQAMSKIQITKMNLTNESKMCALFLFQQKLLTVKDLGIQSNEADDLWQFKSLTRSKLETLEKFYSNFKQSEYEKVTELDRLVQFFRSGRKSQTESTQSSNINSQRSNDFNNTNCPP